MKELILRLIKDGKIVGYLEIQCNMEKENPMMAKFTRRNNALKTGIHPNIMLSETGDWIKDSKGKFDSFDMGIKVDDTWWFENDEIYLSDTKRNYFLKYSDNPSWDHWRLVGKSSYRNFNGGNNCKLIGSIYDKDSNG